MERKIRHMEERWKVVIEVTEITTKGGEEGSEPTIEIANLMRYADKYPSKSLYRVVKEKLDGAIKYVCFFAAAIGIWKFLFPG